MPEKSVHSTGQTVPCVSVKCIWTKVHFKYCGYF